MVEDVGDILLLIRRAWLDDAAFGADVDRLAKIRNALSALFQHARFFDRQMNLLGINIPFHTTHRRGINIKTLQNICRCLNAQAFSDQFEFIVSTVDFDSETELQLFDITIKGAAQIDQAFIISRFEGNLFYRYVQIIPLGISTLIIMSDENNKVRDDD